MAGRRALKARQKRWLWAQREGSRELWEALYYTGLLKGPWTHLAGPATGPLYLPFSLPGIFFPRSWHGSGQRSAQMGEGRGAKDLSRAAVPPFCPSFLSFHCMEFPFLVSTVQELPYLCVVFLWTCSCPSSRAAGRIRMNHR